MEQKKSSKGLVDEKATRHDGSRGTIPTPCGRGSSCASEASYKCRGGVFGMNNRNGNPPTLTLPLEGGREQVSNNSDTPQSLINSNHFTHLTHFTHFTHFKKAAFTLAEVLITIGVIGIVAAMTIPNLVQNYKKKEYSVRVKQFYSMMTQIIKLSEIDNGNIETWHKDATSIDDLGNVASGKKFTQRYILPYLKYSTIDDNPKWYTTHLNNGSSFSVKNGGCYDVLFDVNGDNGPDKYGQDRYVFLICLSHWNGNNTGFQVYDAHTANTREKAKELCQTSASYCNVLLYYDNWEFKENYPYKF